MALDRAGLTAADIGLVLAGGCSPQHTIPAEACMIAAELGIAAQAYDVASACSSFAAQIHTLMNTKPEALPDHILIVNPEMTTRTVDYRDRSTAVLWGDGAAAIVVSPRKPGRLGILGSVLHSDPSGWDKVSIPTGQHFRQNGPAVQTFAIRKSGDTWKSWPPGLPPRPVLYRPPGQLPDAQLGLREGRHPARTPPFQRRRIRKLRRRRRPGRPVPELGQIPTRGRSGLVVVGSGLTWGGVAFRAL